VDQTLWQAVLGEIELSVSRAAFAAWFKKTELQSISDNSITVSVPNIFAKQQLESRFDTKIRTILEKNGTPVGTIRYTIPTKREVRSVEKVASPTYNPNHQTNHSQAQTVKSQSQLNPKYNLDSFVVGSSNDLAYTVAQAIIEKPGERYNPMFIYGGVGLGKTHLIQAIGNEIIKRDPKKKVLYINTETFVSEFIYYLRTKKGNFSDRYRGVDVLIVDDIQFMAGKETTEEEFFHTFNILHQANKQIIISSDKPPKKIPTITDRLRSRLEWGMAIDIQMPDFETRCVILQTKAAQAGFTLEKETIEYLAGNIKTNIRELEGALNQLLAFCEMRGITPDLHTAEGLLGNIRHTRPRHLTAKQVIQKVAQYYSLDIDEICSAKRDKHIILPRQIAMYLLRSELHESFPNIAKALGRKDHTTAMHSVEKITKSVKLDYSIRESVAEIREKLYV
jgi:chromosomal replication initiator protein